MAPGRSLPSILEGILCFCLETNAGGTTLAPPYMVDIKEVCESSEMLGTCSRQGVPKTSPGMFPMGNWDLQELSGEWLASFKFFVGSGKTATKCEICRLPNMFQLDRSLCGIRQRSWNSPATLGKLSGRLFRDTLSGTVSQHFPNFRRNS